MTASLTIGIFVGGAGKRMGGVTKGLLIAPGGTETLVERLLRLCQLGVPDAALYLVGQSAAYEGLSVARLRDDPEGVGPIGGLRSLLLRARSNASRAALALACDLPFLDENVISTLAAPLTSAARVPFADERLQPLAAAYAPARALDAVDRALALGQHRLMQVLDALGADIERVAYDATHARTLRDWDTPEDVQR